MRPAQNRKKLCRKQNVPLALLLGACGAKKHVPIQGEVVKRIGFQGNAGLFGGVADSSLRGAMEQGQSAGMWWMNPSERAVTLERMSGMGLEPKLAE